VRRGALRIELKNVSQNALLMYLLQAVMTYADELVGEDVLITGRVDECSCVEVCITG